MAGRYRGTATAIGRLQRSAKRTGSSGLGASLRRRARPSSRPSTASAAATGPPAAAKPARHGGRQRPARRLADLAAQAVGGQPPRRKPSPASATSTRRATSPGHARRAPRRPVPPGRAPSAWRPSRRDQGSGGSSTAPCGTKRSTRACRGKRSRPGSARNVATTCTSSPASPSSAARTRRPSSWNSEEGGDEPIGRSMPPSHSGLGRGIPVAGTDHHDGVGPIRARVFERLGAHVEDERRPGREVVGARDGERQTRRAAFTERQQGRSMWRVSSGRSRPSGPGPGPRGEARTWAPGGASDMRRQRILAGAAAVGPPHASAATAPQQ